MSSLYVSGNSMTKLTKVKVQVVPHSTVVLWRRLFVIVIKSLYFHSRRPEDPVEILIRSFHYFYWILVTRLRACCVSLTITGNLARGRRHKGVNFVIELPDTYRDDVIYSHEDDVICFSCIGPVHLFTIKQN